MTKPDPLADPHLWRLFLRRLSLTDPDYDYELLTSFAEAVEVDPHRVWVKLKASIILGTATRH